MEQTNCGNGVTALIPFVQMLGTLLAGLISGAVAIFTTRTVLSNAEVRDREKLTSELQKARRTLLREKLEEIVILVGKHCQSVEDGAGSFGRNCIAFAHGEADASTSGAVGDLLSEALALCVLYHPDLQPFISKIRAACVNLYEFQLNELRLLHSDVDGWKQSSLPDFGARHGKAISSIYRARVDVLNAARDIILKGEFIESDPPVLKASAEAAS